MVANTAKLENELKDLRGEVGAAGHGTPSGRREKTTFTGMKVFEKMEVYTGEASQWKDWRFKVTTWLTQTNPSVEKLMAKFDHSELEPKEP